MYKLPDYLLKKYDVPSPRYTSYPTVPAWKGIDINQWVEALSFALAHESDISFYLHVPFCQTLCSFCGCTKMITKDRSHAKEYISALHQEFSKYQALFTKKLNVREVHLGGGSPTWLSGEELEELLNPILKSPLLDFSKAEISIEIDPRTVTDDFIQSMSRIGVKRVSLGVQDFEDDVLKAIRRDQPYSLVENVYRKIQASGIKEINLDLVFGLPYQTLESIERTINKVIFLKPTRIAFYSYAHVPNLKPAQKLVEKAGLPEARYKRSLYEKGAELLLQAGYFEVGMDHFALQEDPLYQGHLNKTLHRNFMGYTIQESKILIGLGPSSLSDSWSAFAQNEKDYFKWKELINQGYFPIVHGHLLTEKETIKRQNILNLMCQFETEVNWDLIPQSQRDQLDRLLEDDLISIKGKKIKATEKGQILIRNVCMAIDDFFEKKPERPTFSQSV